LAPVATSFSAFREEKDEWSERGWVSNGEGGECNVRERRAKKKETEGRHHTSSKNRTRPVEPLSEHNHEKRPRKDKESRYSRERPEEKRFQRGGIPRKNRRSEITRPNFLNGQEKIKIKSGKKGRGCGPEAWWESPKKVRLELSRWSTPQY